VGQPKPEPVNRTAPPVRTMMPCKKSKIAVAGGKIRTETLADVLMA
jgi:hypothetical protein